MTGGDGLGWSRSGFPIFDHAEVGDLELDDIAAARTIGHDEFLATVRVRF